ncbi:MAG TPA: hypothetical protein VKU00_21000 [Chthonomonadaceae bacterium]|nr:hypothetical protein [Chthonomonadaceae bacterium]
MKRDPSNNPIVVGILFTILCGTVAVTCYRLLGGGTPHASTASMPAGPTNGDNQPISLAGNGSYPRRERDPFFHPRLRQSDNAASQADLHSSEEGIAPSDLFPMPTAPLATPTLQNPVPIVSSAVLTPLPPASKDHNAKDPNASGATPNQETERVHALRLTAILGGREPRAVIESADGSAVTVHMGDRIGPLVVAFIHTDEIVLRGERGFWTLPLQAADTEKTEKEPIKETTEAGQGQSVAPPAPQGESIHEGL